MSPANYRVRNPKIERLLREIGHTIGEQLPEGWGFGLFVFSFGPGGAMFWVSKGERASMVEALQEWLRKEGVDA